MPDHILPWTYEEERALLLVRAEEEVVAQIQGTSRDTQVYGMIAEKMAEHGFERNKKQVKNKLKYIKSKWQKVVLNNNRSGRGKKTFHHEELCVAIWGHRPSTNPVNIISSTSTCSTAANSDDSEDEVVLDHHVDLEDDEEIAVPGGSGTGLNLERRPPCTVDRNPVQVDHVVDDDNADADDDLNLDLLDSSGSTDERETAKAPVTVASAAKKQPVSTVKRTGSVPHERKKKSKKTKLESSMQAVSETMSTQLDKVHERARQDEQRRAEAQQRWEESMAERHQNAQLGIIRELNAGQKIITDAMTSMMSMFMGVVPAGLPGVAPQQYAQPGPVPGPVPLAQPHHVQPQHVQPRPQHVQPQHPSRDLYAHGHSHDLSYPQQQQIIHPQPQNVLEEEEDRYYTTLQPMPKP